jgi:hypothetical protein
MPRQNMNETTMCIAAGGVLAALLATYLMASSFYDVVPARHQAIWTQFQRVKYDETSSPGFYWKSPLVKGIHMFTGPDKDEVSYTCGTKDGITFKGKVAITNQLLPENVLESYSIHGENPDKANIYDMAEFLMQSICAEMTAREFLVDKFTDIDDLLYDALVEAQTKAKSGLKIEPGKVKVFKPVPTNSNIGDVIKMEAEHRQSTRTADEEQKLNAKQAVLAADKQQATEKLARLRNIAEQLRRTDSQEKELARQKDKLNAEKERAEIRHEMDRAQAKKEADVTNTLAEARKKEKILEAEANVAYLTPAKLQEEAIKSFYNNHKHTFGNKGELPGLLGLLNMDESNKKPLA